MRIIDIIKDIAENKEIPRFYVDDETREYYMKDGFLVKHKTCFDTDEYDEPVYWNMYPEWFNEEITIVDEKKKNIS